MRAKQAEDARSWTKPLDSIGLTQVVDRELARRCAATVVERRVRQQAVLVPRREDAADESWPTHGDRDRRSVRIGKCAKHWQAITHFARCADDLYDVSAQLC